MRIVVLLVALFAAGCSALPDRTFAGAQPQEYEPLFQWHERAGSGAEDDCVAFHSANGDWGQVIGCQGVETMDVRSLGTIRLVNDRLLAQGCKAICKDDPDSGDYCGELRVRRSYVRTTRHFMVLDKEARTLWYVPEGYYSDGLSIPDAAVPFLAFLGQGTADAKTLPSALFHDRYICLKRDARNAARELRASIQAAQGRDDGDADRALLRPVESLDHEVQVAALDGDAAVMMAAADSGATAGPEPGDHDDTSATLALLNQSYRRNGCSNDAFQNALRTSGNNNWLTSAMRSAVSLANRGPSGYCPERQYTDLAAFEQTLQEQLSGLNHALRQVMSDCRRLEPTVLCLSDRDNLREVLNAAIEWEVSPGSAANGVGLPPRWRDYVQLAGDVFCLNHSATRAIRVRELGAIFAVDPARDDGVTPASVERYREQVNLLLADDDRCEVSIPGFYTREFQDGEELPTPQQLALRRDSDYASPLRAGDVWIEIAPLLQCRGPEEALEIMTRRVGPEPIEMGEAMINIIVWNRRNLPHQDRMPLTRAATPLRFFNGADGEGPQCLGQPV